MHKIVTDTLSSKTKSFEKRLENTRHCDKLLSQINKAIEYVQKDEWKSLVQLPCISEILNTVDLNTICTHLNRHHDPSTSEKSTLLSQLDQKKTIVAKQKQINEQKYIDHLLSAVPILKECSQQEEKKKETDASNLFPNISRQQKYMKIYNEYIQSMKHESLESRHQFMANHLKNEPHQTFQHKTEKTQPRDMSILLDGGEEEEEEEENKTNIHSNQPSYKNEKEKIIAGDMEWSEVDMDICEHCEKRTCKIMDKQEYVLVCPECGMTSPLILSTKNEVSYDTKIEIPSNNKYLKEDHFKKWIDKVQGKSKHSVDSRITNQVREECKRLKIRHLDHTTCRTVLKQLNLQRFYDQVPRIIYDINEQPFPQIPPEHVAIFVSMFQEAEKAFINSPYYEGNKNKENSHKYTLTYAEKRQVTIEMKVSHCKWPKKKRTYKRHNMLSYPYLARKFSELMGWDEYIDLFPLLSGAIHVREHDRIFKWICDNKKGRKWEFYPTNKNVN